ncbi:MAG: small basic family protein [Firmicutes bacterium]|jgi:small basic protein|nr:small basic family protein [Bacillota bacterium]
MWVVLAGLVLGVILGYNIPVKVPMFYARYMSVAFLAALDSVFGGLRAGLEGNYDVTVFVTGFAANSLLAAVLTYIGDRLGVELYYAALFAFGYRVFLNLGVIRRLLLKRLNIPAARVVLHESGQKGNGPSR